MSSTELVLQTSQCQCSGLSQKPRPYKHSTSDIYLNSGVESGNEKKIRIGRPKMSWKSCSLELAANVNIMSEEN